ncbi:MAG: P-loop NTPase [Phycisphaerales bacterium]
MSDSQQPPPPPHPRSGFTPGESVRTRVRVHDGSDQAQRLRVLVDSLHQHSHMHTARITVVDTRAPSASDAMYMPDTPLLPRNVRIVEGLAPAGPRASPTPASPLAPASNATRTARILTIASGKGGVGKTNLAVNLAIAFASSGQRVALIDADMGVANADVLCGLNPKARLDQALSPAAPHQAMNRLAVDAPGGFRLVPGAVAHVRSTDTDPLLLQRLIDGLADLDASADLLILDAPAGVGPTVLACVEAADRTIVVATPEPTSVADAYALIKTFHLAAGRAGSDTSTDLRLQLVINQAADEREARKVHERIQSVSLRFLKRRVPLAGWVPLDAHLPQAVRARQPLLLRFPTSPASKALTHLARDLAPALSLRPAPTGQAANASFRPGFVRRLLGLG